MIPKQNNSISLLATTGSLMLGGSTTFLLNLGAALRARGGQLPVVSFSAVNEMEADFAAREIPVERLNPRGLIYEDRILQAYRLVARWQPRILTNLESLSFEYFEREFLEQLRALGFIKPFKPCE